MRSNSIGEDPKKLDELRAFIGGHLKKRNGVNINISQSSALELYREMNKIMKPGIEPQFMNDQFVSDPTSIDNLKRVTEKEFLKNPVAQIVSELIGKVDPHGIEQHSPGAKLDAGKPMADLLLDFGRALLSVAEVGTYGAHKYTRGGWQHVPDGVNRYTGALLRHLLQEAMEDLDKDTDLLHASHAAWNALARLELLLRDKEKLLREQASNGSLHTTDKMT